MADATPIVNNSGTGKSDSIYVPFDVKDSVGNIGILLEGGDSVICFVRASGASGYSYSTGNLTGTSSQITTQTAWTLGLVDADAQTAGNQAFTTYFLRLYVPTIATGGDGIYTYKVIAWDRTNSNVRTVTNGYFYLESARDLSVALDNADAAVSTRSTFAAATDSVTVDASNFASRTGIISATNFVAGAIDANAIATDAIGAAELAAACITSSELAPGAITTSQFATGAIDNNAMNVSENLNANVAQISTDGVAADNLEALLDGTGGVALGSGAIASATFAAGSITSSAFAAGAINAAAIATDAIDADAIATDAIGADEIAASAIGEPELATGAITSAEFASGAITAAAIATDAFGAAELADDAVEEIANKAEDSVWNTLMANHVVASSFGADAANWDATAASSFNPATDPVIVGTINANVITASAIAADAIGSSELATDAITSAEIAADAIGSSELATDAIGSAELATDAIGAAEIATDAIGALELAPDAITATEIATGAIGSTEFAAEADIWNVAYNTAFTAGTMGDSLNNATKWTGSLVAELAAADRLLIYKGVITGATTPTTFIASGLTQADDYWNSSLFALITGPCAGQARYCSDFVSSTDQVVFADPLSTTPGSDSFYVWAIANPTAVGGGSNWTNAQRDSVLRNMSDGALTTAKIAAGAFTSAVFGSGAITSTVLAANAITASQIATDAITASQIAADAIGSSELATDAITSAEIADNAINAGAIATDAITAAKIAAAAITSSEAPNLDAAVSTRSTLTGQGVWDVAFATGFAAGSMGDSLNNASYVQGAASGLTAAQIWNYPFASAFSAGSMGDSLNNATYVQGAAASVTDASIYAYFTAGSNEDAFKADVSALALQSEVANINGWNPAADPHLMIGATIDAADIGAGAITSAKFAAGAIDNAALATGAVSAGKFAAGAIDASAIATDAIGAAEVADNAIDAGAIATDAITAAKLATDAIGSAELAATAAAEIQASVKSGLDTMVARQDTLLVTLKASRWAALRFGAIPSGYDSTVAMYRPMNGTSNKDSLFVLAYRNSGTVVDTICAGDYRNPNAPSVADAFKTRRNGP